MSERETLLSSSCCFTNLPPGQRTKNVFERQHKHYQRSAGRLQPLKSYCKLD
jgi:hypothetical protein